MREERKEGVGRSVENKGGNSKQVRPKSQKKKSKKKIKKNPNATTSKTKKTCNLQPVKLARPALFTDSLTTEHTTSESQ